MKRKKTCNNFQIVIRVNSGDCRVETTWCLDCHRPYRPFMPERVNSFGSEICGSGPGRTAGVSFEQYDVTGIPSLIAFKKGQELTRFRQQVAQDKRGNRDYLKRTSDVANHLHKAEHKACSLNRTVSCPTCAGNCGTNPAIMKKNGIHMKR